jgi:predicted O-methyltransferase YrrM
MAGDISITNPAIHDYLEKIRPPSDEVLRSMETLAEEREFPYLGAQCGRLLYGLVKMSGAKRIFELGSGFGYTMYWMAKAFGDGGLVIGTEHDPTNVAEANEFFRRGGLLDKTEIRRGDAIELFSAESGPFDLVFCDIGKEQYPQAFDLAKPRLRPGGILAADNILRHGRVLSPDSSDAGMRGILEFTRRIYADSEFFSVVIPIRDGISISIKAGSHP